jgi:tetratricopeptide (TPR) repeat protein
VYAGALPAPFFFDDLPTVVENPSIRHLGAIGWILRGSRRPLTNLSFAVDHARYGTGPFGWHLTNVLLHALVCLLLFLFARRLLRSERAALFAASLFAVHPLLVESVAYVSSRAGLLCAALVIGGLIAWQRFLVENRIRWLLIALLCWPLGALAKETGLLAPILWLACDRLLVDSDPAARRRRLVRLYLPIALVLIAAAGWRALSYFRLESGSARPHLAQLSIQLEVLWRYLFLFIAPLGLSVVHAVRPIHGALDPIAWLCGLGLVAAIVLCVALRREAPAIAFGAAWFGLLLLPSSLAPLGQPMAEHRVYESCAGAAIAIGAGFELFAKKLGSRLALAFALSITLAFSIATIVRVRLWRDPVALWQDAADKAPREWSARLALGDALRDRGDCPSAIDSYRAAIALRPEEPRAAIDLALCQATLGRLDEAAAGLEAALARAPLDATVHYNLGLVEARRGRAAAARAHLERAAQLDPRYPLPCEALKRLYPLDPPTRACSGPGQIR